MTDMNDHPSPNPESVLRPNESRAKNAILMLQIVLALEVILLVSNYLQYNILYAYQLTEETAEANDTRQQIIGTLYLAAFIISAVTFIKWFRRAYYNLSQLDEYLSYQQKDTGIVWFIPIMNLYRPYQIMKEMYRKTRELLDGRGIPSESLYRMRTLNIWWTLWVINSVLGNISFRLSLKSDTIEDIRSLTELEMVINLIGIPLALFAIRVVRNYAQVEPLLEETPSSEVVPTTSQSAANEGESDHLD